MIPELLGISPALAQVGLERARPDARGAFVFRCPVCRKTFRNDDPLEPICTGPSESRDEHEPALMVAVEPR